MTESDRDVAKMEERGSSREDPKRPGKTGAGLGETGRDRTKTKRDELGPTGTKIGETLKRREERQRRRGNG